MESFLIEAFFRTLYGPALNHPDLSDACVSLWTRPSSVSIHCPLRDIPGIARQAAEADENGADVYFGVTLRRPGLHPGQRGSKTDLLAATALWVDIDIASTDGAHASKKLPQSVDEAMLLVNELGLPPDQLIHSGNGLHVYWYLESPMPLRNPEQVAKFEKANVGLQKRIEVIAAKHGWHLDMTANADRVLRVPGTHNRKAQIPASPTPGDLQVVAAPASAAPALALVTA